MPPAMSRDPGGVTATRWSLIARVQSESSDDAGQALAEFGARYAYPVYAYLRCCGHAPEAAYDRTRQFFWHVANVLRGQKVQPTGRFREWLLRSLEAFMAAGGPVAVVDEVPGTLPPLAELERRNRHEYVPDSSPAEAYQRGFALDVIARSCSRLRAEAIETGHLDMYIALEPFLAREPQPADYERLATRLGNGPLAVKMAVRRLRQRLRELVHAELASGTRSPDEIADELRVLLGAMGGG